MKISWSWAFFLGGVIMWHPPSAYKKALVFWSSSTSFSVDLWMFNNPQNFPTLLRLNQCCYLLSTSTSISLRLNSSDLLLLDAFNKESSEDILLYTNSKPRHSFITQNGYKNYSAIYFHSLIHSGGTWLSSEICINSSRTKALLGPSCK